MTIRVEFVEHRSPKFAFLLRLCKRIPTYKETNEDGMLIYSIEFSEKEIGQFRAIHDILYGWPRVAYFFDGKLIPRRDLFRLVWETESDQRMDRWAEKQIRNEKIRALFHRNPNDAFLARLKKYGLFGQGN